MRDDIPSSFQESTRKVSARALISRDQTSWVEFPALENEYPFATYSTSVNNNGLFFGDVVQYGVREGDHTGTVYRAFVDLNPGQSQIIRDFQPYCTLPAVVDWDSLAISAYGDELYCAVDGKVYRYNTSTFVWELLRNFTLYGVTPKLTIDALPGDRVAVAAVHASSSISDHCELAILEDTANLYPYSSLERWSGHLPKHTNRTPMTAVAGSGNEVHLYVNDWSGKKPIYMLYNSGSWSVTKEILPMDALDDESSFSVGCASVINNRYFLTGTIKRKYGPAYSIYMQGPENITFGRDLFIQQDYTKPLKLFQAYGKVWAVGIDDFFCTDQNVSIFTDSAPTISLDLHNFSLDQAFNQGDRLGVDIPGRYLAQYPDDLVPGARLDLEVSSDGNNYVKLGQFGINSVRSHESENGASYSLDCTSHAIKKLTDWQSDTYFDYIGQGEAHGDPGDLTKLVRFNGSKFTSLESGGLQIESLNDSGMLYTTVSASCGGFIRCKFTNVQTTDTMLGVGLNYGEETLAEAAARLNKKIENVKAGERGRWAVMAIYTPNPLGGPANMGKLQLIDYNTLRIGNLEDPDVVAPYRVIETEFVDRPAAGGTMILEMHYRDNFASVYYVNSDSVDTWSYIYDDIFLDHEIHPTEHENYGRGLLFMRNNTGYHMSYPFMSDSDVIPLYSQLEKYDVNGVPLEDRTDRFPATNGTVQVDSERILYEGLTGYDTKRVTTDLQWVPGKVIANVWDGSTLPPGADIRFAENRNNNYVLQSITVADGTAINAVKVWVKKNYYPEDGVMLTINQGAVGTMASELALVNNALVSATVSSSQIKPEGGWVTFYFDKPLVVENLPGQQLFIMLRRSKNWTHPASGSYFHYKAMTYTYYPGHTVYHFSEDTDRMVDVGTDLCFVLYARVDSINKEYLFPVVYQSGVGLPANAASEYWGSGNPTALQDYWNGCAITITKGQGINNCYRIVRSFRLTDGLNDLFCFALDRDPGKIFGNETKARAVPAFYGLKRGQNDASGKATLAAAHGGKSLVHMPRSVFAKASYFEYFTADEDLTLAEVAERIARKAGVVETDMCNRLEDVDQVTQVTVPSVSQNVIFRITVGSVTWVRFRKGTTTLVEVRIGREWEDSDLEINAVDETTGLMKPIAKPVIAPHFAGEVRVSLYNGRLSMWVGGNLFWAAVLPNTFTQDAYRWDNMVIDGGETNLRTVFLPQADTRVDYSSMDMGRSGFQLLQNLIGEKRVYFRDDGTGRLKIFTDRETVPGEYTRAAGISKEVTDSGLATRVLLEGGEVVEVSSAGNLQKYGNLFKTFNFHEINNLDDAQYFAGIVLEDMSLNREPVEIDGAADPRIEPTDIVTVRLPGDITREVVVDRVSQSMHVDEMEAVYDMRFSGRFKPQA